MNHKVYRAGIVHEDAPEEVRVVARLYMENAVAAGFAQEIMYCHPEYDQYGDETVPRKWCVGDNYESGGATLVYVQDGEWYYRSWEGDDKRMKKGFAEAKANASIMFTG